MTDADARLVWHAELLPFGSAVERIHDLDQRVRFPGQYQDDTAGAHYNYQRWYDPGLGRYLQSDPIGLAGGINTYAYVSSNPLRFTDPLGLAEEGAVIGGAIGGVIGAIIAGGACTLVAPGVGTVSCGTAGGLQGAALGTVLGAAAGSAIQDFCEVDGGDDEDCEKAKNDARRAFNRLRFRRIPQYMHASRHGFADQGHHDAITEAQARLKDAIRRVRLHCKIIPPELERWEEIANQPFPVRH